jgi:diguanylate cyclase (GGDEF)-like protein
MSSMMMATTDALTALPNRRAFDVVIEVLFNEGMRNKTPVAIIMLDIDHFKSINDRYGHLGGDYVLSEAARIIKSCLRASDFVCRWGGEEFLVIIKDCNKDGVMALAEKIRRTLEQASIMYKGKSVSITASLGACMLHPGQEVDLAIERADKAMYLAKSAGRNKALLCREDA